MKPFIPSHAATAAVVVLAFAPLQAAEHQISTQEVEAYLQQVEQEATDLVRAGELERMVGWIDENFADGAVLQASMNIIRGEEQKGFLAIKLDKDDLLRVGGMFAGPFGQMEFEDFSLEVAVIDVIPHGPGAASVASRWTERFTLALPAVDEAAGAAGEPATVEEVVDCNQIVQRSNERLQMGLMTCTGEIRF